MLEVQGLRGDVWAVTGGGVNWVVSQPACILAQGSDWQAIKTFATKEAAVKWASKQEHH